MKALRKYVNSKEVREEKKVVAKSLGESLKENRVRCQMTQEFAQRLSSQGLSIDQYMQFTGLTPQKMMEDLEPQALKRIQSRLVIKAIFAAE